jgi:hypothetical protein
MNVLETAAIGIASGILGVCGFLYKRIMSRLDACETKMIHQDHLLSTKLDREAAKELVSDKLAPIIVTLQDIKKDLDEISRDVKKLGQRPPQ